MRTANLSILSLFLSNIHAGPFYSSKHSITVERSSIKRSFTTFILCRSSTFMNRCFFSNFLSSVLKNADDGIYELTGNITIRQELYNCKYVTVNNCIFIRCQSTGDNGGAINADFKVNNENNLTITNSKFSECSTPLLRAGGAIYSKNAVFTADNLCIIKCRATYGMSINSDTDQIVKLNMITSAESDGDQGSISIKNIDTSLSLSNMNVSYNKATGEGGAFYIYTSKVKQGSFIMSQITLRLNTGKSTATLFNLDNSQTYSFSQLLFVQNSIIDPSPKNCMILNAGQSIYSNFVVYGNTVGAVIKKGMRNSLVKFSNCRFDFSQASIDWRSLGIELENNQFDFKDIASVTLFGNKDCGDSAFVTPTPDPSLNESGYTPIISLNPDSSQNGDNNPNVKKKLSGGAIAGIVIGVIAVVIIVIVVLFFVLRKKGQNEDPNMQEKDAEEDNIDDQNETENKGAEESKVVKEPKNDKQQDEDSDEYYYEEEEEEEEEEAQPPPKHKSKHRPVTPQPPKEHQHHQSPKKKIETPQKQHTPKHKAKSPEQTAEKVHKNKSSKESDNVQTPKQKTPHKSPKRQTPKTPEEEPLLKRPVHRGKPRPRPKASNSEDLNSTTGSKATSIVISSSSDSDEY